MKNCVLRIFSIATVLACCTSAEASEGWVTADKVSVRTCASTSCGQISWLLEGQKVEVLEKKNGWGRISKYYDASCVDGKSQYVDSGPYACEPKNGIVDGEVAEWVSLDFVSRTPPKQEEMYSDRLSAALASSDNFRKFSEAFLSASQSLIAAGTCSEDDFVEMGGWAKATGANADKPVYFTYCGGMDLDHRLYLDAATGQTFR